LPRNVRSVSPEPSTSTKLSTTRSGSNVSTANRFLNAARGLTSRPPACSRVFKVLAWTAEIHQKGWTRGHWDTRGHQGSPGDKGGHRGHQGTPGDTGGHRGTVRDTRGHRGTLCDTREHRGTPGDTGGHQGAFGHQDSVL
jgi:hypothetical protein